MGKKSRFLERLLILFFFSLLLLFLLGNKAAFAATPTPNPSPSPSNQPVVVIIPPTPSQFSAYVLNNKQVKLSWFGCRGYSAKFRIYRSVVGPAEGFIKIGETNDMSYLVNFGQEKSSWFLVTALSYEGIEGFSTYVLEVKTPKVQAQRQKTVADDLNWIFEPIFASQVLGVKVSRSGEVGEKTTKSFFDSTGLSYLF